MAGRAAGRLLPILGWLPFYQRASLLPDVLAGLAVWAVMVPESMAALRGA
jgi:SulP family sulfate permease